MTIIDSNSNGGIFAFGLKVFLVANLISLTEGFGSSWSTSFRTLHTYSSAAYKSPVRLLLSSPSKQTDASEAATSTEIQNTDAEWEYEEYTALSEEDFYGSEWKVGNVWNSNPDRIEETWVRLITKDNQLVAYWGDGSEGKWSIDESTQFFSVSKESFGGWLGKKIWAGVVDDYYYLQGSIRGWSPLSPASVLGQWQFKRLGVSDAERGAAPWLPEEPIEEANKLNDG